MAKRKGLGLNLGKGYKNLLPNDSLIHGLSSLGVKTKLNAKSQRYIKPIMPKDMSDWLKEGIIDYEDADKFYEKYGVTPNYARIMYKHPKGKLDAKARNFAKDIDLAEKNFIDLDNMRNALITARWQTQKDRPVIDVVEEVDEQIEKLLLESKSKQWIGSDLTKIWHLAPREGREKDITTVVPIKTLPKFKELTKEASSFSFNAKGFKSMNQFIDFQKAKGFHFFDRDTKKYFNSLIHTRGALIKGKYFITSEKFTSHTPSGEYYEEARKYTVRMAKIDGSVDTIGKFQQFKTLSEAKKYAELLK